MLLILVPVAALLGALGIPLIVLALHNAHPAAWLLAGPYEIAISIVVLFATDAFAERMG